MEPLQFDWATLPSELRAALDPIRPDVAAILQRRLGREFHRADFYICWAINEVRTKNFLIDPELTRPDPSDNRLRKAIETIQEVVPHRIRNTQERMNAIGQPGFRAWDQLSLERDRKLLDAANEFDGSAGSVRAPDPRSTWHFPAQTFSDWIEQELLDAGLPLPTRNSAQSPLVVAIVELLGLIGQTVNEESVRKAIVGKSRRSNFY